MGGKGNKQGVLALAKTFETQTFGLWFYKECSWKWRIHFFSWFDDWLGTGRLIEETGDMGPQYLGIPRHALVADACRNGNWEMRIRGRRVYEAVYEKIDNALKPDENRRKDVMLCHFIF